MIPVKIHLSQGAKMPVRATPGAAAYDIYACLPIDTILTISPGDRIAIPTGIFMEIPQGWFLSVRPRSGLALKQGLTLINPPATIDCDYRGELKIAVINLGSEKVTIEPGDRIAQVLLERMVDVDWQISTKEDLSITDRSSGGFGSTGLA
jgi:dUTP pyrophosphatase